MRAAQGARALQRSDQFGFFRPMSALAEIDAVALDIKAPLQRTRGGNRHDALIGIFRRHQFRADRMGEGVIDANERDFGAGDEPLLDGGVILHRPVTVDVVGREIDQHADSRLQ